MHVDGAFYRPYYLPPPPGSGRAVAGRGPWCPASEPACRAGAAPAGAPVPVPPPAPPAGWPRPAARPHAATPTAIPHARHMPCSRHSAREMVSEHLFEADPTMYIPFSPLSFPRSHLQLAGPLIGDGDEGHEAGGPGERAGPGRVRLDHEEAPLALQRRLRHWPDIRQARPGGFKR